MADPIWLQKLKRALSGGSTPSYDIDITHQYGKPHRERLNKPEVQARFGPSGPHPGIESGYMGGIVKTDKDWNIETPYTLAGKWNRPEGLWQSGGPNKIPTKKKGNKLKYIVEALREMEGETPGPLPGRDRVGGTRPGMPGYTPTNMGAYVGDPVAMQAALAEARRKKEKEGLMNLLHGGYV